jgi:hypothetical protein
MELKNAIDNYDIDKVKEICKNANNNILIINQGTNTNFADYTLRMFLRDKKDRDKKIKILKILLKYGQFNKYENPIKCAVECGMKSIDELFIELGNIASKYNYRLDGTLVSYIERIILHKKIMCLEDKIEDMQKYYDNKIDKLIEEMYKPDNAGYLAAKERFESRKKIE